MADNKEVISSADAAPRNQNYGTAGEVAAYSKPWRGRSCSWNREATMGLLLFLTIAGAAGFGCTLAFIGKIPVGASIAMGLVSLPTMMVAGMALCGMRHHGGGGYY